MTYSLVPARYNWKCKRCKSPNMEFAEHDENCDVNYRCKDCKYSWWVDGCDS